MTCVESLTCQSFDRGTATHHKQPRIPFVGLDELPGSTIPRFNGLATKRFIL